MTNSIADSDIDSLFNSSNNNEIDIISISDIDSLLEVNNNIDNNILLFNNEV
jgi:hypothetical protein